MPVFIYDAINTVKDALAILVEPARRVFAFVAGNPKATISLWGASLWVAIRYL